MVIAKDYKAKSSEYIPATETTSCFLCGSMGTPLYKNVYDRLLNTPGTWSFLSCPSCGLFWLSPRPAKDDTHKLYGSMYCTHSLNEQKSYISSLRTRLEQAVLKTSYDYNNSLKENGPKWLEVILPLLYPLRDIVGAEIMWLNGQQKGRLLDVGCGNGRFLSNMRSLSWDVIGVEPDPIAANIAREYFKLTVIPSGIEEADLPVNSFQAVTLRHVIEHVHDPIGLLRKCYRLLAPGGKLVILTPNVKSLGHLIFGPNWSELDPPRHLYLFSPKTLFDIARQAGLPPATQVRSTARAARWTWTPSASIRSTGRSSAKAGFAGIMRFVFWSAEEFLRLFPSSTYGEELLLFAYKE